MEGRNAILGMNSEAAASPPPEKAPEAPSLQTGSEFSLSQAHLDAFSKVISEKVYHQLNQVEVKLLILRYLIIFFI